MTTRTIFVNARFLTQRITGVQRFAIELCLRLKKSMAEHIIFLTPHNILQSEYAALLEAKVIGNNTGHLWEQIDLPRFLKSHNKPLLLCLCNTAPIFYPNKISTIHDVAFEAYPSTFNKLFCISYKMMIPRIIRHSKHIITVSKFSRDEISKYYGTDSQKISIVYNAASHIFKETPKESLRSERYFLAVSSLNYRKNFISVLEAFELFIQKCNDINLYIIGDLVSSNFQDIDISRFKENPQIKFLGRVSDHELMHYYSNAEAFIYPSLYEGFGIPPLEAQSCGCPVLVSDIPPLHEVVGNSGLYCNPYSIQDISNKMYDILNSKNLSEKGKANACRFSWDDSATIIENILKEFNHERTLGQK